MGYTNIGCILHYITITCSSRKICTSTNEIFQYASLFGTHQRIKSYSCCDVRSKNYEEKAFLHFFYAELSCASLVYIWIEEIEPELKPDLSAFESLLKRDFLNVSKENIH